MKKDERKKERKEKKNLKKIGEIGLFDRLWSDLSGRVWSGLKVPVASLSEGEVN